MGDLVDLNAYRIQKQKELDEKEKAEQEEKDREEIEYMRTVLISLMEQLGDPEKTGSLFYAPMSDDDYYNHYSFESGYNDDGYYESTWEWDGPMTDGDYLIPEDHYEED